MSVISFYQSSLPTLDRALAYMRSHDKVWFARGSEIIEAYKAQASGV